MLREAGAPAAARSRACPVLCLYVHAKVANLTSPRVLFGATLSSPRAFSVPLLPPPADNGENDAGHVEETAAAVRRSDRRHIYSRRRDIYSFRKRKPVIVSINRRCAFQARQKAFDSLLHSSDHSSNQSTSESSSHRENISNTIESRSYLGINVESSVTLFSSLPLCLSESSSRVRVANATRARHAM